MFVTIKKGVMTVLFLSATFGQAETIGLWKIDYAENTGANLRCLLQPEQDMVYEGAVIEDPGLPWDLPPNPDSTDGFLDTPANSQAVLMAADSTGYLGAPGMGPYLDMTNSFTVEGWINRSKNPTEGIWHYVLGTRASGQTQGWLFTLRNVDDVLRYELFAYNAVKDRSKFNTVIDPADTNCWQHMALVYDHQGGAEGFGQWELFIDSESMGVIPNDQAPPPGGINLSGDLYLGGRPSDNGHAFRTG